MRLTLTTLFVLSSLAAGQDLTSNSNAPDWSTDWIDYDRDGLVDSLLLDANGPARLQRNLGNGEFEDVTRIAGLADARSVTRALWQDFDRDGHLDVLLVAPAGRTELYRADGQGAFRGVGAESGLQLTGVIEGAKWFDFDGDQNQDLLVMAPREHRLYRNDGRRGFAQVRIPLAPAGLPADSVTSARADSQQEAPTPPTQERHSLASSAVTLGGGSATVSSPGSSAGAGAALTCSAGVDDFANPGSCIPGSTTPTLGMLYPLSTDWYIDGFGSVGLGTTSPTARLDVDGLIRSRSGGIEFPDGSVQATATLVGPEGPQGPQGIQGDQGIQGEVGPQGPAGSDALWQVTGNHMFHDTGRVGIGTDDPQDELHVSGGDVQVDRGTSIAGVGRDLKLGGARSGSSNSFASITLRNYDDDGSQTDYTGAQIQAFNDTGASSGSLAFRTNDGTGLDEALRIASSGHVGIGNSDPQDPLHVSGHVRVDSGNVLIHRGSNDSGTNRSLIVAGARNVSSNPFGTIEFQNYDSDGNQVDYTGAKIESFNETSADSGNLKFTVNDGSSLVEAMRIDANGRIGIGTASPQNQLDVDGSVRSRDGGFEFPDGSVQTTAAFEGQQHLALGVGDFIGQSSDIVLMNNTFDGVWTSSTGGHAIVAPIHLPQGAKVTGYTIHMYDVVTTNLRFEFSRKQTSNNTSNVFGGNYDAAGNSGYFESTKSFNHTINNEIGNYFMRVYPVGGFWPGSTDLAIQSVMIHWTME